MHTIQVYDTHSKARRYSRRVRAAQLWSSRVRMMAIAAGLAATGALVTTLAAGPAGTRTVTIPAGVTLVGALDRTITTARTAAGLTFAVTTAQPVALREKGFVPSRVVIRGAVARGTGNGRVAGAPELTLQFTEMEIRGQTYRIVADPVLVHGRTDAPGSVAELGGRVVITGTTVATRGGQIVLPAGQQIRIRLAEPVAVEVYR
ncbi:MAG TPA: hypothetical protein VFU23_14685 [Gemmatimonadales bacterium]|nr:hypothetical protein [Gemmatimonadales bacterium]